MVSTLVSKEPSFSSIEKIFTNQNPFIIKDKTIEQSIDCLEITLNEYSKYIETIKENTLFQAKESILSKHLSIIIKEAKLYCKPISISNVVKNGNMKTNNKILIYLAQKPQIFLQYSKILNEFYFDVHFF